MESPKGDQKGGGTGLVLVGLFIVAIIIALYFMFRKKKPETDGGGEGGGTTPPTGAQSQTQTSFGPGSANVDLNQYQAFNRGWAMAIDALGSMLIDKLEEKFREEEERKQRAADADERARAEAEAKAKADADARARAEAEAKAKADADARSRAEADRAARDATKAEALKAEEKAKIQGERSAVGSADESVRASEPSDALRGETDFDRWDSHPVSRADAEVRAGEEEFARNDAHEKAVRGDVESRGSGTETARRSMGGEVGKAEAKARASAEGDMHAADVTENVRGEIDRARTKIDASAREATVAEAVKQDVADATGERNTANADASSRAREEIKAASNKEISGKEANARETADGQVKDGGKKSWGKRMAEKLGRGRIGSAQVRASLEREPIRDPADGKITGSDFPTTPHDGAAHGSFGDIPSQDLKKTSRFTKWFGGRAAEQMQMKNKTPVGHSTSHMTDSKIGGRSAGGMAKAGARELIGALDKLNAASDLMMVFQVFADSFFYGAFPDESMLITPQSVANILKKSIQKQIDVTTDYNEQIDQMNSGRDYKWAHAQWPVIMGPLDIPEIHGHTRPSRYADYEQQQLVQAEIDSVRENLLRKPGPFKDAWISAFSQADYDAIKADPNDSLVEYVDGNFDAATSDELYRQAFKNVCAYYDGVMYEDIRSTSDDPVWRGRPRFQCGWKNHGMCEAAANKWLSTNGNYGGQYAEWYTFDDLNNALQTITETPAKPITACGGTGTTYASKCEILPEHPLRRSGKDGMCVVSTAAVASICNANDGSYDVTTHSCIFSPQYCQSIGTCFDSTSKMCYLPGEAMFAVSMVFGSGGPREWIKINGCQFASSPQNTFENIMTLACPLTSLFTKNGQTFWTDMYANNKNWNEGLVATLGNPVMAAMISSMVVTSFAGEAIASMLVAGTATAGETAGVSLVIMAIAIGIAMGVMVLQGNETQNKGPPDPQYGPYASEYTVGGWRDGVGTSPPLTLGFNRGWVTKPIKAHQLTNWPPTALTHVDASGATVNTPVMPPGFSHVRDMGVAHAEEIPFYADHSLGGAWTDGITHDMGLAVTTYTQLHDPPVAKNLCYMRNKIRAGANSSQNKAWCMDPFPPEAYADTVNIGALMPEGTSPEPGASRRYSTSRTWTDGANPGVAQYPFGPPESPYNVLNGDEPGAWHYQLVYDKDNMVGLTDVTTSTGTTVKGGFPTNLWNTDLLQFYFLDTTIQEMRQYYCIQALAFHPDGTDIPDKCWGYLDLELTGNDSAGNPYTYKYMPMTIPGEMMSSATPTLTQVPTCRSGYAVNPTTNICEMTAAQTALLAAQAASSQGTYGSSGGPTPGGGGR